MCLIFDRRYRRKLLKIREKNVPILGWKAVNKPGVYREDGNNYYFENYSGVYFVREYKPNRDKVILNSRSVIESDRNSLDKDPNDTHNDPDDTHNDPDDTHNSKDYGFFNINRGIHCYIDKDEAERIAGICYGRVVLPVIGMSSDLIGFDWPDRFGPSIAFTQVMMSSKPSDDAMIESYIKSLKNKYSFEYKGGKIIFSRLKD